MVAFLIVDTKIHDAEAYETYKAQARPIAEKYGVNIGPAAARWRWWRATFGARRVS